MLVVQDTLRTLTARSVTGRRATAANKGPFVYRYYSYLSNSRNQFESGMVRQYTERYNLINIDIESIVTLV